MTANATRLPVVFFGHGNPMNTLERNSYTKAWRRLGTSIRRPKSILAVSAHWYTRGTFVTAMKTPRTIHDFGGFPQELFEVQYPAPGDPALATRVRDMLEPVGVSLDESWGLDHGTWSVLVHAFPDADIPVVQLSIDGTKPPRFHYELAKKLTPLRDEGVLIIGSGNVVHNLGLIHWTEGSKPYDWAIRFNDMVRGHLAANRHESLIEYDRLGDDARRSVPTPDHYLPLLYIIALQQPDETISFPIDGIEHGSIGMLSAVVGLQTS